MTHGHNVAALDVGDVRVGVAMTNTIARLPHPVTTLVRGKGFWDQLGRLFQQESIAEVVVGLPRSMDGSDSAQTTATRTFIAELEKRLQISVAVQDEALTSKKAEQELNARGKKFSKSDIDALAATYILEDYLNERNR